MPDEKLDELINFVVFRVGNYAKGRQAIIDYHNKKIQEATKSIRAVWEKYEFGRLHIASYNEILMVLRDVKQAIKKDLEGK